MSEHPLITVFIMLGLIGISGIITIPICLYYHFKNSLYNPHTSKKVRNKELELYQKEQEYNIKSELLEKTINNNEIITQVRKERYEKELKEKLEITKLEAKREALQEAIKTTETNYKTIIDDKNNNIKTLTDLVGKLTEALSTHEKISIENK